jgi:hypothetical protein
MNAAAGDLSSLAAGNDNTQGAALSKAMQSNGHANRFIFNPDGEHMVPYEDWIKYSTEFLRESSSKR